MQSVKKRQTKLIIHTIILIAVLFAALYKNLWGTGLSFSLFPCFFKENFHLYCPGCGCTRALNSLLSLNLIDSFMSNPLILYFVFLFMYFYIGNIMSLLTKKQKAYDTLRLWTVYLGIAMIVGVFLVRNLLLVIFHYDYLNDLIR